MRRYALSAGVVLSLVLVACTGDDAPAPTAPVQLHHVSSAATCDRDLARTITGEITNLYKSSAKSAASARWRQIQDLCPAVLAPGFNPVTTNPNAQNLAVDYFNYFLTQWRVVNPSGVVGTTDDWARHFNHMAIYVNIDQPTYQIEAASFTDAGAIQYCAAGTYCFLATKNPSIAALRINPGATDRPVLATIARAFDTNVCQGENLEVEPYCARIETTPEVSFKKPYVDVQVCHRSVSHRLAHRLVLAHPTPGTGDNSSFVDIAYPRAPTWSADPFPFACSPPLDVNPYPFQTTAAPVDQGPVSRAFAALGRLAGYGFAALSPEPLYATDAGKIGTFPKISPIGPVDPYIFDGYFDNDPVGPFPLLTSAAEEGQWWDTVTSPGSLTVQTSTAFTTGQIDTVLVLSQGGGNCTNTCGGLLLAGSVESFPNPGRGVQDVRWESMQEKPSVKDASFFVRTGLQSVTDPTLLDRPSGDALARLSYRTLPSPVGRVLVFNDEYIVNGFTWVPGRVETFTIRVDLYQGKVAFYLNDSATPATFRRVADGTAVTDSWLPYYSESARGQPQRVGQFTAEFMGIDAGVVYIDNVAIFRRYDAAAVPDLPELPVLP